MKIKLIIILLIVMTVLACNDGIKQKVSHKQVIESDVQEEQLTRQQIYDQLYHLYSQSSQSDSVREETTFVLALTACVVGTGTEEVLLKTLPTDYLEGMIMYLKQLAEGQARSEQSSTH